MPALLRLLRGWHDPDSFRSECLPCAVFKVRCAEHGGFSFEGLGIRDQGLELARAFAGVRVLLIPIPFILASRTL